MLSCDSLRVIAAWVQDPAQIELCLFFTEKTKQKKPQKTLGTFYRSHRRIKWPKAVL